MSPAVSNQIQFSNDVLFQTIFDEAVILSIADGHYFGLNDLATRIWQLLAEHGDSERVISTIMEEYDVDESMLRRDYIAFLAELERRGFINCQTV